MRRKPKAGDKIWITLERVTKAGDLFGSSSMQRGPNDVKVREKHLKDAVGVDLWKSIRSQNSFIIRSEPEVYTEIVNDTWEVEIIPKDQWPERNEDSEASESTYEGPQREEGIEWDGSPQKRRNNSRNRNDVFSEGDSRGDRNDLL